LRRGKISQGGLFITASRKVPPDKKRNSPEKEISSLIEKIDPGGRFAPVKIELAAGVGLRGYLQISACKHMRNPCVDFD
jgi:hypothetical protein